MDSHGPTVDWHRIEEEQRPVRAVVDSRVRLRAGVVGFFALLAVVFGRVVQLEVCHGAAFREVAGRPVVERRHVPVGRGRIVSSDGVVLAEDRQVYCLAVRYRDLTKRPAQHGELAALCGMSDDEWERRASEVQTRVERIAESVNRRRLARYERDRRERPPEPAFFDRWFGSIEEPPPERVVVREQYDRRGELDYHVMAEEVSEDVAAAVEGDSERFAGARIVRRTRREYPAGAMASHVVGYLGRVDEKELERDDGRFHVAGDRRGRAGVERSYEAKLRGRCGWREEQVDRSRRVVASEWAQRPEAGADLVLSIDTRLQETAERLLDEALARRAMVEAAPEASGGAVVVMDVDSGAIAVAASAPRFDPAVFSRGGDDVRQILEDPAKPLFDRTIQMAIAPGSVMKVVSAVALVESRRVRPGESFYCRGYLEEPTALRCQIYREHERGHGEVTLADALAVSCNVYFFHHAANLGPAALLDWAGRFGLGRPTGVDLPGEAAGRVPTPETIASLEGHKWSVGDTRRVAVGQGSVTATPVQVARVVAAVANGGRLVVPHVGSYLVPGGGSGGALDGASSVLSQPIVPPAPRGIAELDERTLEAVRRGLRMAVASPEGTARATVFLDGIEVAGKTGTAQTGGGRLPHAWFAGYVPAGKPRYAVVVVLEHAGGGGEVAGPVAQRVVRRMRRIGLVE